ncbi:hypothetical protein BDV11DRAFT_174629 [Aspergillus similis]
MDRMPSEIKRLIARCTRDESMESLRALSQVDQEWNRIARPLLYEHIIIRVLKDRVPLKFLWKPDAKRVLVHVKRLSIVATWYPVNSVTPTPVLRAYSRLRATIEDEDLGDRSICRVGVCPKRHWAAVVDFVRHLAPLQDIDLLISNGGPIELHQAISQYHPTCRLSVYSSPSPTAVRYGKAGDWVQLPQLHAAHVTCFEYPVRRKFSEHPDRVLEDIIVRAPHVKKLALRITAGGHVGPAPDYNETVVVERTTGMAPSRTKLEQLSWPLNTRMPAQQFLKWDQLVDYSCLRSWAANELAFYSAAKEMFDSLPPLTYLCLLGAYKPTLLTNVVLRKHGSTLLELKLNVGSGEWNDQALRRLRERESTGPIFPAEKIQSLAAQCPSLQRLRICIQRNRGFETDVYTALAQLPRLTELDLLLNCPPQVGPDETPTHLRELTDFENAQSPPTCFDLPIWFLRDTTINSAIDQDLAKALFTHIRTHHTGSRRLVKLTIRPSCSHHGPAATRASRAFSADIFKVLASSWTLETDLLAGCRAVEHPKRISDKRGLFAGQLQLEVIFNSIWPALEDDGGQLSEWHSWPLQPA